MKETRQEQQGVLYQVRLEHELKKSRRRLRSLRSGLRAIAEECSGDARERASSLLRKDDQTARRVL